MKKVLSLNGLWTFNYYKKINNISEIFDYDYDDSKWIKATVPGDVHLDLVRAGIINEPLYDKNAEKCKWVDKEKWIYRKKFNVPTNFTKDRTELVFEGLDTTAEIWLNGKKIGSHTNAFITYRIDITAELKTGENILVIKLSNGQDLTLGKELKKYICSRSHYLYNERLWVRKPQFTFGWDWAPRLITCGIWRPVYIISYEKLAIRDVFIYSKLKNSSSADIYIEGEIENFTDKGLITDINISLNSDHTKVVSKLKFSNSIAPGINRISTKINIKNPRLWFPRTLGIPYLYNFKLDITEKDKILDKYNTNIGIREVTLLQEPIPTPENGKTFTFMVNGVKVFCKGANWVPSDSILARVSRDKYWNLVKLAAEANFNMFRIWGGGIYEDKNFYEACDYYGIMVWQEFMFSCSPYPDDDNQFCAEVEKEAISEIKRLRNHPSIVLWCGNNENDWIYEMDWVNRCDDYYGRNIYHHILPELCKKYDPTRPYWPSSPYGGKLSVNDEQEGDHHSWFWGSESYDYRYFDKIRCRFISEYGMYAPPVISSIKEYLPKNKIRLDSDSWKYHTIGGAIENGGNEGSLQCISTMLIDKIDDITVEKFIIYAQFIQAELLKYASEHFRRRKFVCSGTLFWMYNDCWPTVSWSVVDYYLRKKPGYYYIKRAYEPVIPVFKKEEYGISVWIVNDTLLAISGDIEYGLQSFTGKIFHSNHKSIKIGPNCSVKVADDNINLLQKNCFYYAKLKMSSGDIIQNRFFSLRFKDMLIPKTKIGYRLKQLKRDLFKLELWTTNYALMVQIDTPDKIECSDNYFDIFPNEKKEIALKGDKNLIKKIRVRALNEEK